MTESLAGRAAILELEPLAFAEARAARPRTPLLDFVVRGGMPELHSRADLDLVSFHNSCMATHLERDVRTLANVGSLRDFERFLRACALRSANLLNTPRPPSWREWRTRREHVVRTPRFRRSSRPRKTPG